MTRKVRTSWAVGALAGAVITGGSLGMPAQADQIKPSEGRAEQMRQHFDLVTAIRDAVIRGDLSEAHDKARMVAAMPDPINLPPAGASPLQALKAAAQRVERSADLPGAASATASMLSTCGDCHRAVGTMPAHPTPPEPKVGGVIGHMETHRNAADLMSQGLTTPSTSLWRDGAEALATAPLHLKDLPDKAKLPRESMKTEAEIHALALRAREAAETGARVAIYGELIAACSTCHAGNRNGYAR